MRDLVRIVATVAAVAVFASSASAGAPWWHRSGGNTLPPQEMDVLLFGQSNMERMWAENNYTQDAHTTNGSCNITSSWWANIASLPYTVTSPSFISGTYVPAGDKFTTSGSTIVISPTCATGTTASGTLDLFFTHISATGIGNRYQAGGSQIIYPVDDPPYPDEFDYANTSSLGKFGFPPGAVVLSNSLQAAYPLGVLEFQLAVPSTAICEWVSDSVGTCSGAGDQYTPLIASPTFGFSHNSRGISTFGAAIYQQGEQDAVGGTTQANYLAALQNILAYVKAYAGAPPLMVAVLGNMVGLATDSATDAIVQAELQLIDGGNGAYFGGNMRPLPTADYSHYSSAGRVNAACWMAQAVLKAKGKAAAGYGPTINAAGVVYDGSNILTIPVIQETGTGLRAAGQAT